MWQTSSTMLKESTSDHIHGQEQTHRQLAPTVGPWPKGVYITGEALLGMRRIAIGEIIIDLRNNYTNPDTGSDQIEVSDPIFFGQINAFVGMVKSSGPGSEESEYESLSETAVMTQSDGEE